MGFIPPRRPKDKSKFPSKPKHYELIVPVLVKSLHLKELVQTDEDRRALILTKYNLSSHTLYCLLKDYTNDPYNERWICSKPYERYAYHYYDVFAAENYYLEDTMTTFIMNISYSDDYYDSYEDKEYNYKKCGYVADDVSMHIQMDGTSRGSSSILSDEEVLYTIYTMSAVKKIYENNEQIRSDQKTFQFTTRLKNIY